METEAMNRRSFLGMLAGATLDPERLLWIPGRKLISIPRQRVIIDPLLAYQDNFHRAMLLSGPILCDLIKYQDSYNRILSAQAERIQFQPHYMRIR